MMDDSLAGVFDGPDGQTDMPYLLVAETPTTSRLVKHALLADWGLEDAEFIMLAEGLRDAIKQFVFAGDDHDCVFIQGGVAVLREAALSSFAINKKSQKYTLVIANGAHARQAADILQTMGRPVVLYNLGDEAKINARTMRDALQRHGDAGLIYMVHCEPASGIINDIEDAATVAAEFSVPIMLDATTTMGAATIDISTDKFDVLLASSHSGLQGIAGLGMVITKRSRFVDAENNSKSYAFDLHRHWREQCSSQYRSASNAPYLLVALNQAVLELVDEGGINQRIGRYCENRDCLLEGMQKLGFTSFTELGTASHISQSFDVPAVSGFDFRKFKSELRQRGFVIQAGLIEAKETFRIATIGDIDRQVIKRFLAAVEQSLSVMHINLIS